MPCLGAMLSPLSVEDVTKISWTYESHSLRRKSLSSNSGRILRIVWWVRIFCGSVMDRLPAGWFGSGWRSFLALSSKLRDSRTASTLKLTSSSISADNASVECRLRHPSDFGSRPGLITWWRASASLLRPSTSSGDEIGAYLTRLFSLWGVDLDYEYCLDMWSSTQHRIVWSLNLASSLRVFTCPVVEPDEKMKFKWDETRTRFHLIVAAVFILVKYESNDLFTAPRKVRLTLPVHFLQIDHWAKRLASVPDKENEESASASISMARLIVFE